MNNLFKKGFTVGMSLLIPMIMMSFKPDDPASTDWKQYYEDADISIEYTYQDCKQPNKGTHNEYVYLKIRNGGTEAITVEFDKELWYNDNCLNCDGPAAEHHYRVALLPGETKQAQCGGLNERALEIFSKMVAPPAQSVLTEFKLNNIKITVDK